MTMKPTDTRASTQGDKGEPFRPKRNAILNARGTCIPGGNYVGASLKKALCGMFTKMVQRPGCRTG